MNGRSHARPLHREAGLSLVEALIGVAVAAVLLGTALPGFDAARERRHIEGTAAQIETDIAYTRSLAVAQNRSLRVSFSASPQASCYVIHTGSASACSCDARGAAVCSGDAQALRTVSFAASGPVAVRSNSRSMLMDAHRGTVTPTATVQVQGRSGETLHVVVNIMGRVRNCAATTGLPGHAPC